MYPETCINHAGDEQMKSMIPETSSEINWRDYVRDVSSNWHRQIHPSRAGVQDALLCAYSSLWDALPNSLSISNPLLVPPSLLEGEDLCHLPSQGKLLLRNAHAVFYLL